MFYIAAPGWTGRQLGIVFSTCPHIRSSCHELTSPIHLQKETFHGISHATGLVWHITGSWHTTGHSPWTSGLVCRISLCRPRPPAATTGDRHQFVWSCTRLDTIVSNWSYPAGRLQPRRPAATTGDRHRFVWSCTRLDTIVSNWSCPAGRLQRSAVSLMMFSVPQTPVLGPLLYVLYTIELDYVVAHRQISLHQYADNGQIYVCSTVDQTSLGQ